ncbi:MAG: lysylphosphatidylglycerol synthase transmembrane domain-containing protein [Methylococcaceae bacterium]
MKKKLLTFIKIVGTAFIVYWIITSVDWGQAWGYVTSLPMSVLMLTVIAMLAGWVISAIKWRQLLLIHKYTFSLVDLTRWYSIAFFLSQFLPSAIGGDAYRIYKTFGDNRDHKAISFLSVFIERVTGFAALLIMGGCVAIYLWLFQGDELSRYFLIILVPSGIFGLLSLWFIYRFNLSEKILRHKRCPKVVVYLVKHSGAYKYNIRKSTVVILLSFLFHGLMIFAQTLLIYSLTGRVMIMEVTIVLSLTTFLSMLPISIGGYGLVDGSFMLIMSRYYGLDESMGIVVALLIRLMALPISFIGGAFYLLEGKPKVPEGAL